MLTGIVIWSILMVLAAALLFAIISGRMSGKGSSAASITVFHDFQPRDKQDAAEVVIEQHAGKKWDEQKSAEGTDDEVVKEEKNKP